MNAKITRKEARYLACIYREQVEEGRWVTTTILAKAFKVAPATITESFQKLAKKNLVEYTPYYGIKLTEIGIAEAKKLLRKHRLLEILLVRLLKYSPKAACNEASKIDYHCSETLTNSICSTYNHPMRCPCNKQIFRDDSCQMQANNRSD